MLILIEDNIAQLCIWLATKGQIRIREIRECDGFPSWIVTVAGVKKY
ncbi:MAG TPA: hypothetical protein VFN35_30225 [Ktedonobacteraceae bacterium]|nr:hypothetical protein [Ktedonobacteraceae bacterium]